MLTHEIGGFLRATVPDCAPVLHDLRIGAWGPSAVNFAKYLTPVGNLDMYDMDFDL